MPFRDSLARMLGLKASVIGLAPDELPDRALEKGWSDAALLSTYADDAWPYIVGNKIGEQASQAPLQVGRLDRDGEFQPVGDGHPVQRLFDRPNPTMDGGEFVHLLLLYMGLAGHAPIEVVRLGSGPRAKAGELWLVPPDPWRIVANPDGTIRGYLWVRASETDIRWTPDRMTYLRWPNPNDRWYGQGHIQAIRQQVMAEEYASIRDKKLEKNLGVPPGILTSEMPLGDPQAAELQRRWEKAVGGYANAGKVAVLGSKTTYQPVSVSARDAEWLAQRRDRVEVICAAWGMPLPLVRMQDATFSNVAGARAELWEGTLQPRLNRVARMITQRLLPLVTTEALVTRFDYTQIEALGENDLEAAQTATAWANTGAVTVDEVRARMTLGPHPDATIGARLLIPSTMQLKDPTTLAEQEALGLEGQRASIDATRNPEPPQDPKERPAPRRSVKAEGASLEDREARRQARLEAPREQFVRDLRGFFDAQLGALTPAVKALPQDEADAIIDRALAILTAKRWRERLLRFAEPVIRESMTLGAVGAAETLAVTTSFSIAASEEAIRLLTTHLEALGVGIQKTTVEQVREVLTQTLRSGASAAETRTALQQLYSRWSDKRADVIARTETTAAYNLGSIAQYRDAGVTTVRVIDGDDDPCAKWNGQEVTLEVAEGSPLGHPNCRRDWIPVTDGWGVRSDEPAETKDGLVTVRLPSPVVNVTPTVVPAPVVHVAPPVVNVEAPVIPAPVVTVPPADMAPVAKALDGMRADIADLRAEVRKPRKRRLLTDDLGRVTGSEDV